LYLYTAKQSKASVMVEQAEVDTPRSSVMAIKQRPEQPEATD
jgi:hypothetical protein